MRSRYFLMVAAGCAALACGPAAAAASRGDAVKPAAEQVICKKAAPAGTRFRTTTCYTMAEWDKVSEAARRDMGEMVLRDARRKTVRRKPSPRQGD